jgi:hypothetical protein
MCSTFVLFPVDMHPFLCSNEPCTEKLALKKTKETFYMNKYRTPKCVFTFYSTKHKKYKFSVYIYA